MKIGYFINQSIFTASIDSNASTFDLKLEGLKMICIYHTALSDWRGGTAGLKNMLYIFEKSGIKTDLISYHHYSDGFRIEHKKINSSLNSTILHIPSYLPKFLKAFAIFLVFIYAWKPSKRCDIIFAESTVSPSIPAFIFGKIFGKPVILHYTDEEPHHLPDSIYKHIAKNADVIFAISPYLIGKLNVSPEKLYHIEKGGYMILRKYQYLSWKEFILLSPSLLITEILTFGYAIKHDRKGLKYKLKAMKDGLRIKVNKVEGDKGNLFKSLTATIPVDQLTFNKLETIIKTLANKIFEWTFKVVK